MIPTINTILTHPLEIKEQPTRTYKMHMDTKFIHGFAEEQEAMQQAVYKILNTERYQYLIYSHNYGIELEDLFGEPVSYVCSELERRITEALTQDKRITSVDSFSFHITEKRKVQASFVVHTIFGDMEAEKVVNY